jgi:hypothetical protein
MRPHTQSRAYQTEKPEHAHTQNTHYTHMFVVLCFVRRDVMTSAQTMSVAARGTIPNWKLFELYKCTIITKLEDYSNCTQMHIGRSRAHYHSSSSTRPIRLSSLPSLDDLVKPTPDYLMPLIPMIVYPSNDFMKIIIHLQLVTTRVRLHVVRVTHKPAEAQESLHDIT